MATNDPLGHRLESEKILEFIQHHHETGPISAMDWALLAIAHAILAIR